MFLLVSSGTHLPLTSGYHFFFVTVNSEVSRAIRRSFGFFYAFLNESSLCSGRSFGRPDTSGKIHHSVLHLEIMAHAEVCWGMFAGALPS